MYCVRYLTEQWARIGGRLRAVYNRHQKMWSAQRSNFSFTVSASLNPAQNMMTKATMRNKVTEKYAIDVSFLESDRSVSLFFCQECNISLGISLLSSLCLEDFMTLFTVLVCYSVNPFSSLAPDTTHRPRSLHVG